MWERNENSLLLLGEYRWGVDYILLNIFFIRILLFGGVIFYGGEVGSGLIMGFFSVGGVFGCVLSFGFRWGLVCGYFAVIVKGYRVDSFIYGRWGIRGVELYDLKF